MTETSIYAEHSLLGALLINGNAFASVRGTVNPQDFVHPLNRDIYAAMAELDDSGAKIDPVSIVAKLPDDETAGYIRDLMLTTPTAANVDIYAAEVASNAARRRIVQIATDAAERAADGEPAHEVAAWMRDQAAEAADKTATGGLVTSNEAMFAFGDYKNIQAKGKSAATATGYKPLDDILGGGAVSEGMIVLAARPGVGKTSFALNIAERVAMRGDAALFVTLEMSLTQISAKRIASESGMPSSLLLNGNLTENDWRRMYDAQTKLAERPMFFNRAKSMSIDDIGKLAAQIPSLKLLVIDYMGLVRHKEGKTLYEKVTATSNAIKRLARTLGAPILCLVQLNREVEGRGSGEPRMSDIRDSGAIEQDADVIILLHKQTATVSDGAPTALKVIVPKNRHGRTGKFEMNFYENNGRIREWT